MCKLPPSVIPNPPLFCGLLQCFPTLATRPTGPAAENPGPSRVEILVPKKLYYLTAMRTRLETLGLQPQRPSPHSERAVGAHGTGSESESSHGVARSTLYKIGLQALLQFQSAHVPNPVRIASRRPAHPWHGRHHGHGRRLAHGRRQTQLLRHRRRSQRPAAARDGGQWELRPQLRQPPEWWQGRQERRRRRREGRCPGREDPLPPPVERGWRTAEVAG